MVTHGRGLVCLPLTRTRAADLGLAPMVQANTAQFQTNFTVSIEAAEGVTTGISAHDRAHTIRTAVKPNAKPADLHQPGHIFPLIAQPGGVLTRAGHTEAGVDLAMLAGLEPAGVLVEILNPDGSMARRPELEVFAREHGLKMGSIADLIAYRLATEKTVERVDEREIDTEFGPFKLVTYRDRIAHDLHFALVRGTRMPTPDPGARAGGKPAGRPAALASRDDFGVAATDACAAIDAEGAGVMVVLSAAARWRGSAGPPAPAAGAGGAGQGQGRGPVAPQRCRRADPVRPGLGKLRVLGTPRRQIGLAGHGLEVVETVTWLGIAGQLAGPAGGADPVPTVGADHGRHTLGPPPATAGAHPR
jgi:3,4-dihydroxy 2-butanone 4-phosphate synthase/GTP cyclohydrolase II